MNRIYIFIFSLIALSISKLSAQEIARTSPIEEEKELSYTDTIPYYVRMQGFRVGMEIASPISYYAFGAHDIMYSLSLDKEVKDNWYAIVELGTSVYELNIETNDHAVQKYDYKSSGKFVKLGFDYNMIRASNPYHKDMISIGVRLAGASFNQDLNNVSYKDEYWGLEYTGNIPSESAKAFWFEAVLGTKAEICKNLFIGASLATKLKLYETDSDSFDKTQYIAGYGKGFRPITCTLHFSVYYTFPIGKKHTTFLKDILP